MAFPKATSETPSAVPSVLGQRRQGRVSRMVTTIADETTNMTEDVMSSMSTGTNLLKNMASEMLTDSKADLLEAKLNFARTHSAVTAELSTLGYTVADIDALLARK